MKNIQYLQFSVSTIDIRMKTNRILSYVTIKGVLHQRSNPGTTYDIFELFYLRDT